MTEEPFTTPGYVIPPRVPRPGKLAFGICPRVGSGVDVLRAALSWQVLRVAVADDKYHGRVPKFPMLQERNTRSGFFDDATFAAVKAKLPAAHQPVATFAYVTGWRIQSEILPLEWRHIDRKALEARLEPGTTKNGAGRTFLFTDTLQTLIDGQWRQHEALEKQATICRYVFHRNGGRIKGFRKAWANACEAGRVSRPDSARPATIRGSQYGARRPVAFGGDAAHGTQSRGGVSTLCDHERSRSTGRRGPPE